MTNTKFFKFSPRLIKLAEEAEKKCVFSEIDKIKEYNGTKVLSAFINNRVSEQCFYGSSGYGYGDVGREILDKVYAEVFGAEDALVRHNFVSVLYFRPIHFLCKISFTSVKTKQKKRIFVLKERKLYYGNT